VFDKLAESSGSTDTFVFQFDLQPPSPSIPKSRLRVSIIGDIPNITLNAQSVTMPLGNLMCPNLWLFPDISNQRHIHRKTTKNERYHPNPKRRVCTNLMPNRQMTDMKTKRKRSWEEKRLQITKTNILSQPKVWGESRCYKDCCCSMSCHWKCLPQRTKSRHR